jgi:AcrR family transcriptional regulator
MLYHYFPTKDELLAAVLRDHLQQLLRELESASSAVTLAAQRQDRVRGV